MITPDYAREMARYNAWQNRSLLAAADTLDEAARQAGRGAFFGSIAGTLNHILWADRVWLLRLAGGAGPRAGAIPESVAETTDWAAYKAERAETDARLTDWAARLDEAALAGVLSWYSGAAGREVSRPRAMLVAHLFNHQTHHRGQVHAMLTAAGARPGPTDLAFMPADA